MYTQGGNNLKACPFLCCHFMYFFLLCNPKWIGFRARVQIIGQHQHNTVWSKNDLNISFMATNWFLVFSELNF